MLFDAFAELAAWAPTSSGLFRDGEHLPYAEIAARAERLGAGLLERGVSCGAPIAIVLPNGPDLFTAAYALFAIGAVAVPLNPLAPVSELVTACRKAGVAGFIVDLPRAEAADAIVAALGRAQLPRFVVGGSGSNSFAELMREGTARLPNVPRQAPALYLFSSGSTGIPKVVPHTHGEMLANAAATARDFSLREDDRVFNNLPGHHAMGFLNSVFEVPYAGASTVYFSDPAPLLLSRDRLLDAVVRERVSILPGVPFMFDTLAGSASDVDLGRVRLAYTAGVSLKRTIYDRVRSRFGLTLRQAYGCTEAGHVAFNRAEEPDSTWDSVGQGVGDTELVIEPSERTAIAGAGEIAFRSSSLTKGYLGGSVTGAASGGYFRTGDLGRIDEAGNVYILGRAKLMIEIAGHKVDPLEVEEILSAHPAVDEVVVVGIPDPRTGEQRVKAVVVRCADVSSSELMAYGRSRMSSHKVPAVVEFIDAIPKSATGKVLRGRLIEA